MSRSRTTPQSPVPPVSEVAPVSALKSQFLTDMELAGMMAVSRKRYLFAVERLIRHYWCSPADLIGQGCHSIGPPSATVLLRPSHSA